MKSDPPIPCFGTRSPDCEYVERPSAYAILSNAHGQIAVVRTPLGAFLPGGGLHGEESPAQAVARELVEECGLVVEVGRCLGAAHQFLYAEAERTHFAIRSTFFVVRAVGRAPAREVDHDLCWLDPETACAELKRESHRWVIQEWSTGQRDPDRQTL